MQKPPRRRSRHLQASALSRDASTCRCRACLRLAPVLKPSFRSHRPPAARNPSAFRRCHDRLRPDHRKSCPSAGAVPAARATPHRRLPRHRVQPVRKEQGLPGAPVWRVPGHGALQRPPRRRPSPATKHDLACNRLLNRTSMPAEDARTTASWLPHSLRQAKRGWKTKG